MKKSIYILLITLTGCTFQSEVVKPRPGIDHKNLMGNYHSFSKINGRENSTFLPFTTWESIRINQWYNAYNVSPIPKYLEQFVVAADWFDWDHDITEDVTFEIYASPPVLTNSVPNDSLFVLMGSTSSFDTYISLDLTSSYTSEFGSIDNKGGQYVFFKFQWRDSVNNLSTPVYESTPIVLDSSAEVSGVKAFVDGWLHHGPGDQFNDLGYTIDEIQEVHINDTIVSSGGSFFVTTDTVYNESFYFGKISFSMVKTNPCIAGVGFMYDQFGNFIQNDDFTGTCCSPLQNLNWGYQYAAVKVHSSCPITLYYKFDGIKAKFHL